MNEEKENSQNAEFDENKGCGCGGGCGCESPLADDGDEFAPVSRRRRRIRR